MIVASLLLVIAAAVTLLMGLLNREVIEWVWASIACCLLAGLLLTIGVIRSRPSRKPVLQSGGEGAAASWAGASGWAGNGGDSSAAVLTRDDDESTDGTVRVANGAVALSGNDDPTRTDMPAPPTPDEDAASSPWAPTADQEDTGDVRIVEPESAPEAEPAAAAEPAPAEDDVIVVPKPSARGGASPEDAGFGQPAVGTEAAASLPPEQVGEPFGTAPAAPAARANPDDAARFEQVLSPISGVGAAKRAALFQHFGTYRKLRAASPEKLAEVPGISRTLAERIYSTLHGK